MNLHRTGIGLANAWIVALVVLLLAPASNAQQQLILNRGFESGLSNWSASGNFYANSGFAFPHAGTRYLYMSNPDGTPGNNLSAICYQQFSIPAASTAVTLSYYWNVSSTDSTTTQFDVVNVVIQNASGSSTLRALGAYSNTRQSAAGNYQLATFSISEFAGQTIRLTIFGTTDSSLPSVFRFDDVSVLATVPTGACCVGSTCSTGITQANCAGTWQGAGTTSCTNCTPATGACCVGSTCTTGVTQANCAGVWQGAGTTTCTNCTQATGACCVGSTCTTGVTQVNCAGTWQGAGSLSCTNCGSRVVGIDVSSVGQPNAINWTTVAQTQASFGGQTYPITFSYIRASKGTADIDNCRFADPLFVSRAVAASGAGIKVGAYHVASVINPAGGIFSATAEADFFVDRAANYIVAGNLRPALDLEDHSCGNPRSIGYAALATWVDSWMQRVHTRTGVWPVLYCSEPYKSGVGAFLAGQYDLWVADWASTVTPITTPWTSSVVWQYSGSGNVSGIGLVDLNVFLGNTQSFQTALVISSSNQDQTPPTIGQFTVTPSTVAVGGPISAAFTVSDIGGSGLARVEFWRASGDGTVSDTSWTLMQTTILTGNGPVSGTFSDSPPSPGAWYGIHAIDNANHLVDERMAGFGPARVTVITPSTGACCVGSTCTTGVTQANCAGTWQGVGTTSCNGCTQTTGACCIASTCTTGITQANCAGTWQGAGTTSCTNCTPATGACCVSSTCTTGVTQANCGGTWQGAGTTTCTNCTPVNGACCISSLCTTTTALSCAGTWNSNATCASTPCPPAGCQPITFVIQPGADGKDTCYGTAFVQGGNPDSPIMYFGGWGDSYFDYIQFDLSGSPSASSTTSCVLHLYAATAPNDPGLRVDRITQDWTEAGVTISNNPASEFYQAFGPLIPPDGWRTLDISQLYRDWKNGISSNFGIKLHPTSTNHTNGSFYSSDNPDPTKRPKLVISHTACTADFNCSGQLNSQDIFDFLNAWFAVDPRTNFNGVNGINAQDIFDFLGAWFAGCP